MIDNGMLCGAARHYDERAAAADHQARMAQVYAGEVLDAIARNQPDAPITTFNSTETLVATLIDSLYQPKLAARFVEILSKVLTDSRTPEESCRVLLGWIESAAKVHGTSTAELRSIE